MVLKQATVRPLYHTSPSQKHSWPAWRTEVILTVCYPGHQEGIHTQPLQYERLEFVQNTREINTLDSHMHPGSLGVCVGPVQQVKDCIQSGPGDKNWRGPGHEA